MHRLHLPFRTLALGAAAAVLAAAGCVETGVPEPFTEPLVLTGVEVSPEQLNRGREDYDTHCMQCHGANGDGKGHAAAGLVPPPRDFTKAEFKFAAVEQGELPTDDELVRIIKGGLDGTAMLKWDISEHRLRDVIQYIKTFALDEWEGEKTEPGELVEQGDDPFGWERRDEAVALGGKVYHGYARCYQCHPAYLRADEIRKATAEMIKIDQPTSLRKNWHRTEAKNSSYGAKAMPPDFTWHRLRTVDPALPREEQVAQLYRIVAAGINGAAMPAWKLAMPEEYMWSMAYYIQWLTELRDTPERVTFWKKTVGINPADDQPAVSATHAS